ncbi:hypothetical protein BDZ89DRAFT_1065002 [Hymenopellis radicata]|nr:hypothetical protein BDZ89DRAFT_1065002 [Hymenopellis radicata]
MAMSTTLSPPSYPDFLRSPSYTVEPQRHEQRIALGQGLRPRPSGQFVKESKSRGARLRLNAQEDNIDLPVYGSASSVEGSIEVTKPDGITSVEVKVDGRLRLHELAAGGMVTAKLCSETVILWIKDPSNATCPMAMDFRCSLPATFVHANNTYSLPPTYDVKLDGLPGFTAAIDYNVTATLVKPNPVPLVKGSLFGKSIGNIILSTPFVYHPRTRPAVPLPSPLRTNRLGFILEPDWKLYESQIASRQSNTADIKTKLYIPASRIFCMAQPIPFHLTLESSAYSLAAFLPYGPTANLIGKRATRIQLMRQATVDVRHAMISSTKTDIWRVDNIGEATFAHAGDGPTWVAFSGTIRIQNSVKVAAFKAGGLSVKDCILFTFSPADPAKSPFAPLRQVVPARLTTDVWTADGTGMGANLTNGSECSIPSTPEDAEYAQVEHGAYAM